MSALPSVEAIMLEIHQSLGCQSYPTNKKNKFATGQASLASHTAMGGDILKAIFNALGIDPEAQQDAICNFMEFGNTYKALELNTWTFAADQRQVLWELLGCFYIPGLARRIGFWSLEQPLDKGMPGGRFWYLPELDEIEGMLRLYLPVAQVTDWLLDLLGMPLEEFADKRSETTDGAHDGLRRTLYNWRSTTLPQADTIQKYFADGEALEFAGAFTPDNNRTPAEQFADALGFVKQKKLTAQKLRFEIPMTQLGRLEAVIESCADADEQAVFVKCLAERYVEPSMHTIRQRFLLARTVQDGYFRLLKYLCPDVDRQCTDPNQNKLLQLFAIYKIIYNLTVKAWQTCRHEGEAAENIWFEQHLPEWDKLDLFLSILPSRRESASLELALLLTRKFSEMQKDDEIEGHVGLDEQSAAPIIKRNYQRRMTLAKEILRESHLLARVKQSSPWRALQGEHSFWVISQLAQHTDFSPRAKEAAIQRLRELAATPAQTVQAITLELDSCLNSNGKKNPKDMSAKVQALLNEAESSEGYQLWKAVILQYKAKHLLACNDFKEAGRLFKEALEEASERNYGPLRGEVARDCLALEVANQKLIHNNHEKYYRYMLAGGVMAECEDVPSIEETARWASECFWNDLYKPYHGVPRLKPRSSEISHKMFEELKPLFIAGNQEGLELWIKTNRKLLSSNLPDVDGNSVIMLLIKMYTSFLKKLPLLERMVQLELKEDPALLKIMLGHLRLFLEQIARSSPKQLNIPDLKRQTPLMLMTEVGDTELVKIMLQAGADPEMQDWKGMTALHSAIKSGESGCIDALLDHPCRLDQVTHDGRSPLHTASWTGNLHAVKRLIQMAPELAWQRDSKKVTPLELVEFFIEHPEGLKNFSGVLAAQGNRCASKGELMLVMQLLEKVAFNGTSQTSLH